MSSFTNYKTFFTNTLFSAVKKQSCGHIILFTSSKHVYHRRVGDSKSFFLSKIFKNTKWWHMQNLYGTLGNPGKICRGIWSPLERHVVVLLVV